MWTSPVRVALAAAEPYLTSQCAWLDRLAVVVPAPAATRWLLVADLACLIALGLATHRRALGIPLTLAASLSVVGAPWQRTQATRTVSCSRIAWYDVPARPSVSASVANVGASPPAVPGRRTIGVWHGRHSASRSGSFMWVGSRYAPARNFRVSSAATVRTAIRMRVPWPP